MIFKFFLPIADDHLIVGDYPAAPVNLNYAFGADPAKDHIRVFVPVIVAEHFFLLVPRRFGVNQRRTRVRNEHRDIFFPHSDHPHSGREDVEGVGQSTDQWIDEDDRPKHKEKIAIAAPTMLSIVFPDGIGCSQERDQQEICEKA